MSSDNNFTIVVAISYTEKEKNFIDKSVRSAIRLDPGELLFGIDKGTDPNLKNTLQKICDSMNFKKWNVVEIEPDKSWNFQLAHVMWICYGRAKFDKILSYDIDSELRSQVLSGYEQIGANNLALVSFTKKLLIRSVSDFIRHFFYRMRVKRSKIVFSGVYWLYRPYYYQNVILEEYMKMKNCVDTYLFNAIKKNKKHTILTRKEIGVNSFDIQNEDYPWRQFQEGIWYGTHREHLREYREKYLKELGLDIKPISRFLYSHPVLLVLAKSFMYQYPFFWKGYRWACKNPTHAVVKTSSKLRLGEWNSSGGKYVADLFDWKRTGTGFE